MPAPSVTRKASSAGQSVATGLLGLVFLLSITPAIAALFQQLSSHTLWISGWLLIAVPQLLWCALESRSQPHTRGRAQTCRLSTAQGIAALGIIVTATWTAVTIDHSPSAALRIGALAVIAAGIWLRLRAIRDLGHLFRDDVATGPGHELICTGIFACMRHPSELGLLLILGGTAGLTTSIGAAFLTLLVCLPLSLWRCRREDCILINRFGKGAVTYQHQTRTWAFPTR